MKTNVTMQSEKDRELFGVIIRQNTKDFNVIINRFARSLY